MRFLYAIFEAILMFPFSQPIIVLSSNWCLGSTCHYRVISITEVGMEIWDDYWSRTLLSYSYHICLSCCYIHILIDINIPIYKFPTLSEHSETYPVYLIRIFISIETSILSQHIIPQKLSHVCTYTISWVKSIYLLRNFDTSGIRYAANNRLRTTISLSYYAFNINMLT